MARHTLYCSFCGKSEHEVCKIVAGPTVFICNECVHLCLAVIEDNTMQDKQIELSAKGGLGVATENPDVISTLVDRFLMWNLPQSVCSDLCVTDRNYKFQRSGTNLLTADEARQMFEYLFAPLSAKPL